MKEFLKKLILDYKERLKTSNEIMKDLNKELDENDGQYPDFEFGQNYESEDAFNASYSGFLEKLEELKIIMDRELNENIEMEY